MTTTLPSFIKEEVDTKCAQLACNMSVRIVQDATSGVSAVALEIFNDSDERIGLLCMHAEEAGRFVKVMLDAIKQARALNEQGSITEGHA